MAGDRIRRAYDAGRSTALRASIVSLHLRRAGGAGSRSAAAGARRMRPHVRLWSIARADASRTAMRQCSCDSPGRRASSSPGRALSRHRHALMQPVDTQPANHATEGECCQASRRMASACGGPCGRCTLLLHCAARLGRWAAGRLARAQRPRGCPAAHRLDVAAATAVAIHHQACCHHGRRAELPAC